MRIEIKFYNLDTFKKQVDANCIDLDSESVDLNYKVASLIFCHFWRSIDPCCLVIVPLRSIAEEQVNYNDFGTTAKVFEKSSEALKDIKSNRYKLIYASRYKLIYGLVFRDCFGIGEL